MVRAEGIEVSFPSGHFAFSSVGFKGKPVQIQRFLIFSGVSFFRYSLPIDAIPQEFDITVSPYIWDTIQKVFQAFGLSLNGRSGL